LGQLPRWVLWSCFTLRNSLANFPFMITIHH
jgi:hypothetical protein